VLSSVSLNCSSNDIFINSLKYTGLVALIVSEENETEIVLSEHPEARYVVVTDPLDGSSNIDCNVSVGSIFGIYRRSTAGAVATLADALQPGTALVCSGYAMYGSSTELVLSFGEGVNVFTLDPSIGVPGYNCSRASAARARCHRRPCCVQGSFFLLAAMCASLTSRSASTAATRVCCGGRWRRALAFCELGAQLPRARALSGNYDSFPRGFQRFLDFTKTGEKPYSLRYVGSMVADMHRTILYGGVFCYGPTAAAPAGKLRLLYELNPMSMIMEQAGGMSTTGKQVSSAPSMRD
jgi:fructose-1,6-bisphosphatase I